MSWPMVALGDIFEIARGGSPRPIDAYITDDPDGVNWISIRDASNSSKYITKTEKKILPSGVSKSRLVKPGDFLLTNSMSFGRPYILQTSGCIHDGWLVLSGDQAVIDQDFFYHLLGSELIYRKFASLAAGAVVKNLNSDLVRNVIVPLPPFSEQRRIAAILDKADALRAKRREAIAKLDQLLQSVFLEMFGDPVTNPNKFIVKPLGDVATQVTDGAHHTPERTTHGIPLLSARNVLMGSLKFTNTDFVGQEEYERLRKRCEPKKGDILISCSGSIGRVSVVRTDLPFVLVRSAALVKLDPALVTPTFMEHQLRTPYLQGQMLMSAKSSSQANLFQAPIRALRVLVPPIALQNQFEKVANNVAKRHAELLEAEKLTDSLFFSIQGQAFSGKLFP